MYIIEKKDFDLYRYIVGKMVFLKEYIDEYIFVEDIKESNCFIVKNYEKETIIISIFGQPNITLDKKYSNLKLYVFYQKVQNFKDNHSICKKLKDSFNFNYNESLVMAVLNPFEFININKEFGFLLDTILINASIAHDTSGKLYKYYAKTNVKQNKHKIKDGNISFLNPSTFNDPFDCSCELLNRTSVSDKFRVLCTIQDEKNILMWSYYGSEHKGYCFEYSKHDIISALIKLNINGLCIMGDVYYSNKRPDYRATTNTFTYSNLKFLIDCTFTKYKKWEHEEEVRFVIMSDFFNDNGIATTLNVPIQKIINGCEGDGKNLKDSNRKPIKTVQLSKDKNEYKLL